MIYHVRMSPPAAADMDAIHEFISAYSEDAADRTYGMLKQAILGLAEFPHRYALARESARSHIELRQVIAGNYRVIYNIIGDVVHVCRVVHAAQQIINPADLF